VNELFYLWFTHEQIHDSHHTSPHEPVILPSAMETTTNIKQASQTSYRPSRAA